MPRWMFALWLLTLAMLAPAHAAKPADGLVPVPPLQSRLTDLTGTLSADQQTGLEQSLRAFEARKGTQIAVLMIPTTKPEEIEQYVPCAWSNNGSWAARRLTMVPCC